MPVGIWQPYYLKISVAVACQDEDRLLVTKKHNSQQLKNTASQIWNSKKSQKTKVSTKWSLISVPAERGMLTLVCVDNPAYENVIICDINTMWQIATTHPTEYPHMQQIIGIIGIIHWAVQHPTVLRFTKASTDWLVVQNTWSCLLIFSPNLLLSARLPDSLL